MKFLNPPFYSSSQKLVKSDPSTSNYHSDLDFHFCKRNFSHFTSKILIHLGNVRSPLSKSRIKARARALTSNKSISVNVSTTNYHLQVSINNSLYLFFSLVYYSLIKYNHFSNRVSTVNMYKDEGYNSDSETTVVQPFKQILENVFVSPKHTIVIARRSRTLKTFINAYENGSTILPENIYYHPKQKLIELQHDYQSEPELLSEILPKLSTKQSRLVTKRLLYGLLSLIKSGIYLSSFNFIVDKKSLRPYLVDFKVQKYTQNPAETLLCLYQYIQTSKVDFSFKTELSKILHVDQDMHPQFESLILHPFITGNKRKNYGFI